MIRTFVAIDITDKDIISKIINIQRGLIKTGASMKIVEPENIHITLYFLGEIPESAISQVEDIIYNCIRNMEPFEIEIGGLGAFPTIHRPRVVWIGILKNSEVISSIASCLRDGFSKHGFRVEHKKFHAHITLARIKKFTRDLKDFIARNSNKYIGKFFVESLKLKKSTLTPRGPIYEDLKVFKL